MCNVAQSEVGTVGLLLLIVLTFVQIFVHVAPVGSTFNITPAREKKTIMSYHFVCLILLVCVSVHIPSLSKLWKEDGVSDKDSEIDGLH